MTILKSVKQKRVEGFDWDKGNETKNEKKHKVKNEESEQVFFNNPTIIFDEEHSTQEDRFYVYGQTNVGRLLTIVFTTRNKKIRIISSRPMGRKEKEDYL